MGGLRAGAGSATERAAHPAQVDVTARHQEEGGQLRGHGHKGAIRPVHEPTTSAWWEQAHSGQEVAAMRSSVVVMIRTEDSPRTSPAATAPCTPCGASTSTSNRASWSRVLGPNGAGKSTTMRMLTTLIAPDRGHRPRSAGHDVVAEAAAGAAHDRLRRPGQRRRPQPARRATSCARQGPCLRARPAHRPPPRRRTARRARPRRPRRPQGVEPLRRPAAAAGRRDGAGARADAAVPRRALHRPRPAEPGQPVGAHPAHAAPSTR